MHKETGVDLKEMVLSVLADMQAQEAVKKAAEPPIVLEDEPLPACEVPQAAIAPESEPEPEPEPVEPETPSQTPMPAQEAAVSPQKPVGTEDEQQFLSDLRERLLVIFEGFQSPNNKAIEAKVDLTLNFLEYLLSVTEERLEALKRA